MRYVPLVKQLGRRVGFRLAVEGGHSSCIRAEHKYTASVWLGRVECGNVWSKQRHKHRLERVKCRVESCASQMGGKMAKLPDNLTALNPRRCDLGTFPRDRRKSTTTGVKRN